jgi:aminopeptidase N
MARAVNGPGHTPPLLLEPPMRHSLLVAVSLCALTAAARAETPFDFDHAPGKLPKIVVPDAYRIDIVPDLVKLTLTGQESIDVQVRQATDSVTLNEAGLTLGKVALEDGAAGTVTVDEKAQTATLHFPHPIAVGKHTLTIAYTGPIPETPNGIYYDDYKTPAGEKKRMLVTQFEVADARRMFPGWDEPAFKATFQVGVTVPKSLEAVSNMPAASVTAVGTDAKHVVFATTPRMSTYLLALIAGDMGALHGGAAGTKMTAWAPAGEQDQADYALKAEQNILPYYDDYFGVNFPLPKLDMIAIPGNYAAGAMENWGAITFIDNAMLFDPKTSAPSTREEIHYVVAHEMAHQWSGDLVTMGWWDDIWLNEGFATWMGWKVTDHLNPSWEIWPRQHTDREQAMAQDAVPTTHPIQQVIRDESEANSAFDGISYQKGEQIIRMIEDWIGPDTFRDGMRAYMKAHQFSNATSADLWAALGAAAHRDVASVASGFTEQPGIPLVHVTRSCNGGHATITLTQDRFTIHDPHPKKLTWTVPVTLGAPGAASQRVLLTAQPATITLAACGAPLKANLGEDGYYRTQYDPASLAAVRKALAHFDAADRANLLGDQYALFVAGRAPLSDYLSLLPALHGETNIAVWSDTLSHLRSLHRALEGSPALAGFDAYAIGLVKPEFDRLGWDPKPGESFLDALLRPQVIGALGLLGDKATVDEAGKRFLAFQKDPASLPPALREPVLDMVGHHADQAQWDALKEMGIKATSTEEKLRYFGAMASATDPKLIQENVAFADAGEVPNGRVPMFLFQASQASGKADLVYKLVVPVEAKLAKRLPPDGLGPTVLIAAAAGSSNPVTAKAVVAAPSSNATTGSKIWAARVADMIGTSAELRARAVPVVEAWLKTHKG